MLASLLFAAVVAVVADAVVAAAVGVAVAVAITIDGPLTDLLSVVASLTLPAPWTQSSNWW